MSEKRIRIGGLFRCCIATLQEDAPEDVEGAVHECRNCKAKTVFRDGAWEWLKEDDHKS